MLMPEDNQPTTPEEVPENQNSNPLDGVKSPEPEANQDVAKSDEPAKEEKAGPDKKKLLLIILGSAGAFLLFYLFFAFYLMVALPAPDGGGQGLKAFGNLFYAIVSLFSVVAVVLLALRFLKAGVEPDRLIKILMRPGIAVIVILAIAVMVFVKINQNVPLPIDILEPANMKGVTAPVSITFGTDTLRSILRKQSLYPRKYKWDFNGDGRTDAETTEHEVTTIYKRKGTIRARVKMSLSDGSVRSASKIVTIPNAIFSISPNQPIYNQRVEFDVTNLVATPEDIENVLWDFNGDGKTNLETQEPITSHTFTEIGTYQSQAIIQHKGGLQETVIRPIVVLEKLEQPFEVSIGTESSVKSDTDGTIRGSAPLGMIFSSSVEEGINVRDIRWTFAESDSDINTGTHEEAQGERASHVFDSPGGYKVIMRVSDTRGRISEDILNILVLEPLDLSDVLITGSPKPSHNQVEGRAPLEVQLEASTKTPLITFRWEQENASRVFSSDTKFIASYDEEGTYQAVLIAEDAENRTQKFPIEITVLAPRSRVSFTAIPPTGIVPLNVTFDASQSSVPDGRITGFAWKFGDGGRDEEEQLLGAKASHRFELEGTYEVVVRALTDDGRSFEATKTIVARKAALDACAFPSRTTGTAPMGVHFDAGCSTGEIVTYTWNFGDGATSQQEEPSQDHVFERSGTYTVTLEVADDTGAVNQTTFTITAE
jgi:PKD repeat protein